MYPFEHPAELSDEEAQLAADTIDFLLSTAPQWIHRRIVSVDIIDRNTIRRRHSIDFTVPEDLIKWLRKQREERLGTPIAAADPVPIVIPLDLLAKRALTGFSATDRSGVPISILTRNSNATVMWIAMLNHISQQSYAQSITLSDEITMMLWRMTFEDQADAEAEWERIWEPGDRQLSAAELALAGDDVLRGLAGKMTSHFPLLTVVEAMPGKRHLIKYEQEDQLEHVPRSLLRRIAAVPANILGARAFASSIGFPTAWAAHSFHLEVVAPAETMITRMACRTPHAGEAHSRPIQRRVHLNWHQLNGGVGVKLWFRLRSDGMLAVVFAALGLVASMLLGGLWLHAHDYVRQANSSDAILVSIPAVFAAVLFASGEHAFVRELSRRPRFLLGVGALCSFAAACTLAVSIPEDVLVKVWFWLGLVATVAALAICFEWIASTRFPRYVGEKVPFRVPRLQWRKGGR